MSRKNPPKDRLSAKDVALWKRMTGDVTRVDGADYSEPVENLQHDEDLEDAGWFVDAKPAGSEKRSQPAVPKNAQGLDGRTEKRLRKGQIRPEATLDLHGMGQAEAYDALRDFIAGASARRLRCVLVITGKGKSGLLSDAADWFAPKRGVLKARVPEWLSEGGFRAYVAQYVEAQARDGGSGALYVYLRKISVL